MTDGSQMSLARLVLTPSLPTSSLVQFLTCIPRGPFTEDAIKELCQRDLRVGLTYLLSLPFTHSHRPMLKHYLHDRFRRLPIVALEQLSTTIPHLTALTSIEGTLHPAMYPLDDYQTGLWDTHDWYFKLLHVRNMKGQFNSLSRVLFRAISCITYSQLTLYFS